MKTIKICIIIIAGAICLNSCSLDILPDSAVSNKSYWSTESDAEAAVTGIYTQFRNQIDAWKWIYWFEARGGNIEPGSTSSGLDTWRKSQFTSQMNDVNWAPLYNIISQANAVINNIDKVQFYSQTKHDELLAEAYFFRAWCYFNLARLWGDAPIITSFISSIENPQLYPGRSAAAEVYAMVKSDIEQAATLYTSKNLIDRNRVSRAAIMMLRTDIYLWLYKVINNQADYLTKAEQSVDEVLATPASTLSLQSKYSDVFTKENNSEIIFAIFFGLDEKDGQYGNFFCQSSTLVPVNLRNNPIPVATSNHRMKFSNLFYTKYRNRRFEDTRAKFISDDLSGFRYTLKYQGEMVGVDRKFTTDTRIYRLAEAHLLKAEILLEKGLPADAVAEINKVVKRAYNNSNFYPTSSNVDVVKSNLLDERMVEFAGEAKSWFDLVRFKEVFTRVPALVGRENDYGGDILFVPVHGDAISRNPKIKQTKGYEGV